MIAALRNRTLSIGIVAALQLAALGYLVWDHERRLRSGTDVVLEVIPVDPRSLFQGDYVILGYPISTIKVWYGAEPVVGQDVFVTVVPGPKGDWQYANFSFSGEYASNIPGGVTLKGRIDRVLRAATTDGTTMGEFRVVYGLERFFVPEGKGLNLEALVRDKKLSAIVSVWRDGSSTLKGLSTEGKSLYEVGVAAKRPEDVPPLADVSVVVPATVDAPAQTAPAEQVPATPVPGSEAPPAASPAETPAEPPPPPQQN